MEGSDTGYVDGWCLEGKDVWPAEVGLSVII